MLIRRKRLLWFAAGLLVVGAAFLVLPPYSAYCEGDNANNDYCAAYELTVVIVAFVEAHSGSFTALATVAIAWFTLTLKVSTDKLWDAGERQLKLTRRTARTELRAYVFFSGINMPIFVDPLTQKQHRRITIALNNFGKTRTRNLVAKVSFDVLELTKQQLSNFDFADQTDALVFHGLLGPGQSVNLPPIPVTDVHLAGGLYEDTALLVWGWTEYSDVFSPKIRRTEFALRIRIEGNPIPVGQGQCIIRFESTEQHNAADEDCMRPPRADRT
jgi:hypothetical protein